jgi:CubicO group peptidase (beta-lactamase class C family)
MSHGFVADGFSAVREEFERNFSERGEVGAAFSLAWRGETLVDLYCGIADPGSGAEWRGDTLTVIFSGTKSLTGLCVLMLVDRGLIDPGAPVAAYWPEFAAAGKKEITVAQVMSHQARMPGVRTKVSEAEILDAEAMASILAAQPAESDPRAAFIYHPLTYGWICSELVRRVDGRTLGEFFRRDVAEPLELEIWIGLPATYESRVATLVYGAEWGTMLPAPEVFEADELLARVWSNPPLLPADHNPWNSRSFHAAGVPGAGAIGSAAALARLHAQLAAGGEVDGSRLISEPTLRLAQQVFSRRQDPLLDEPQAFGLGFELQNEVNKFGPARAAFGHSGAGGSIHGSWPGLELGFSYCMNEMRSETPVDRRAAALLDSAYHAALDALPARPPTRKSAPPVVPGRD